MVWEEYCIFVQTRLWSCTYDPCIYVNRAEISITMITLYVDDLLKPGSDITAATSTKRSLAERIEMKNCAEAQYCLGLEIVRIRKAQILKLSPISYAEKVLQRSSIDECKAVCTPMPNRIENDSLYDSLMNDTLYRKAIESLIKLMACKRPHTCFEIGRLSQYIKRPT